MSTTTKTEAREMDWQLNKQCLRERIETLLKTSQWSDCTFRVGEKSSSKEFKAHKLILASCSPVFEAMCFGPLAEKDCISITDLEPEVFRILLDYIYTDDVALTSVEEACGVLYASKKYMLPHLSAKCCSYLKSNLRPSNVLPVLEFADAVQEKELIMLCLDVMCKYTKEVLEIPAVHISDTVLVMLLDQKDLNLSESELFDAVMRWALAECKEQDMEPTGANCRQVLIKSGVFSKIRFLALSLQEFTKGPECSGILTKEEIDVLKDALMRLEERNNIRNCDDNRDAENNDIDDIVKQKEEESSIALLKVSHLKGVNCSLKPRNRISIKQLYCARRFLKTAVIVSGRLRLLTKVQASQSVTVSGIRVFSRLIPQREFMYAPTFPRHYRENMEICVLNNHGDVLCRTVYNEIVEYNTLCTVMLSEKVRFASGIEYSILLVLPSSGDRAHEYPLSFMAQTERSHDIEFRFCDHADINGTGAFVRRLDMGFVDAIVFSL